MNAVRDRSLRIAVAVLAVGLLGSPGATAGVAAPDTRLTGSVAGPAPNGHTVPMEDGELVPFTAATFGFSAERETATFICSLDGVAEPCESPITYRGLASGPHRFEVAARDEAGNIDETPETFAWAVGARPGTISAEPRSLTPLDRVRVKPKRLRRLTGLPRGTAAQQGLRISDELDAFELHPEETGATSCGIVCSDIAAIGQAPKLTSGPFLVNSSANDPNIAVSKTHIVVTNGTVIRFLTKAGDPLDQNPNGTPFPATINAAEFFKWFFNPNDPNNMNTWLNLPPGLQCDPAIYPWGSWASPWGGGVAEADKPKVANCLHTIYDARVIYDDFRDRFWIVASVRNGGHSSYMDLADPVQRSGRRDFLLVAVSSSGDPRGGWWMYPFPSTLDTGACNDIGSDPGPPPICPGSRYRPGDAADYPSIGISEDYFVYTIGVVSRNPWTTMPATGYTNIVAADADQLASGGCPSTCSWSYGRMSVSFGPSLTIDPWRHATQPSVQHDGMSGWTTLAANDPGLGSLLLLGFRASEGPIAPPLHARIVPVAPTGVPHNMPQKPESPVTDPQKVYITNLGRMALKAAARQNDLWATWQDCKAWGQSSSCTPSTRVVGIDAVSLLESPLAGPCSECQTGVFFDKAAGGRRLLDPPGAYASYGMPAVEVNEDRDLAVVSVRSGGHLFPEAVYHAKLGTSQGFEPEGLLKAGTFPLGVNATAEDDTSVNLDTAGAAVDPRDDNGIWIYHGYSRKSGGAGIPGFAIGKLFGQKYFDLLVYGGKAVKLFPKAPGAGERFAMKLRVSNEGDRVSKRTKAKVVLLRKGGKRFRAAGRELLASRRRVLGRVTVPKLKPGKQRHVRVALTAPAAPGRYLLKVLLKRTKAKEYDVRNNVVRRRVRIRG